MIELSLNNTVKDDIMIGILQIFTKKSSRYSRRPKIELLGSNPLFYKVLTVDKKIYKIKRRRWS